MANFLTAILGGTAKLAGQTGLGVAKSSYRAVFSPNFASRLWNTGKMAGVGGVVGGIGAAIDSDAENPNVLARDVLAGALAGAGVTAGAFATLNLGRAGLRRVWQRGLLKTAGQGTGALYRGAKVLGNAGLGLATFAIKHPLALGVGTAATYGALYASRLAGPDSPTLRGASVNTQYDRQSIAANLMNEGVLAPSGLVGTMPQMARPMQRAMMQSTEGLVQGMHRGRHG